MTIVPPIPDTPPPSLALFPYSEQCPRNCTMPSRGKKEGSLKDHLPSPMKQKGYFHLSISEVRFIKRYQEITNSQQKRKWNAHMFTSLLYCVNLHLFSYHFEINAYRSNLYLFCRCWCLVTQHKNSWRPLICGFFTKPSKTSSVQFLSIKHQPLKAETAVTNEALKRP